MTEETGSTEAQVNETGSTESVDALKRQIAELNRESAERRIAAKTAMEELESIKAAQAEAERVAAEEKGEYKELYTTAESKLNSIQEERDSLAGVVASYLEREIEKVPEDKREMIPDLPTAKKLEWLQTHGAALFTAAQPKTPSVKEQGTETTKTLQERYQEAVNKGDTKSALVLKRQLHEARAV